MFARLLLQLIWPRRVYVLILRTSGGDVGAVTSRNKEFVSNLRVDLHARNDVLGSLAVLLAALGVFGTGTGRPDVFVASIMASLALQGTSMVIQQARIELQSPRRTIAFSVE